MWWFLPALGLRAAAAAELVYYAGVLPSVAEQRAATILGRPASELELTSVSAWARGLAPAVVGEATIEVCAQVPTDRAVVERLTLQAETRLLYLDYPGVHVLAAEARRARLCQRTVDDPVLAARIQFLDGVASFDEQHLDAAATAFREVHRLAPGTPWDPDFPPAARGFYDLIGRQVSAEEPALLRIAPFGPEAALLIDGRKEEIRAGGRLVDVPISPGEHLLQLVGEETTSTIRVELMGASATLVLPDQLADNAAFWAADPSRSPQLDLSLSAYLPPELPLTVLLPDATWRREPGRGWYEAARYAPTLTRRSVTNAVVAGAGASLVLGGAALGVASYISGVNAVARAEEAETWDQLTLHQRHWSQAGTRLAIGEGVAALGAVAFGIGLTLPPGPGTD